MSATEGRRDDGIEVLLEEQLAYYRALAPEYGATGIPDVDDTVLGDVWRAVVAALDAASPLGNVLELACGPGSWTAQLLRHAESVTAVDGAPEMLKLAAAKVQDERVQFIRADLFDWSPDAFYDVVFFGFWLSHVPIERFASFWSTVASCLRPAGRVLFVDDAYRTPDELINGEESSTIRRLLTDGTAYRAVKVAHTPADLQNRLQSLGWQIKVTQMPGPFFWGAGSQAITTCAVCRP